MFKTINEFIIWFDEIVWGPKALKFMVKNEEGGTGEVTSFGALCTALSATIGTGNIVGVATAIVTGGPGALFWMWIAAFFGMATKYAEGVLAILYRKVDKNGHVLGGSAAQNFFDVNKQYTVTIVGQEYSWAIIITGVILTLCVGLVLIGGIKRISKVSEIIVPFMAIAYVIICLILLITNYKAIPGAISEIIKGAFGINAVAGGALGSIAIAMQKGIARGIFSNEAGLGSAPIAAAAAQTKEPVRQGLVTMTGTFIDTIIICTMTGLSIVITGSWNIGLKGVEVTSDAFQKGLPFHPLIASFLLMICLIFFAFTTILGWNYYGERCLEYLLGENNKKILIYRWLYIVAVFAGPFMTVEAVWNIADVFNGLMAFPNLIALIALSGVVTSATKDYFRRTK
ncbi:MAG: alanine:cation symporter family protein [Anaerocolumna sp.]|nr:alanine:cation symporter family protein [Anaerocolumna sp.]